MSDSLTGNAELTAAGEGDAGKAEATQLHTHEVGGGADGADGGDGRHTGTEACAVDLHRGGGEAGDGAARSGEDVQGGLDIADLRNVVQDAGLGNQSASEQDRERGVFHTADGDGTVQTATARNQQSVHSI